MNLRDKITKVIWETTRLPNRMDSDEVADQILALIEGERCEWDGNDYGGYKTSCGKFIYRSKPNYCENCGCKVEVKDEAN